MSATWHSRFNGQGPVEWLVRATPSRPGGFVKFLSQLFRHHEPDPPETNLRALRQRLTVCNDCGHIFPTSRSTEGCELCGSASVANLGWRMASPAERKQWFEMIGVGMNFCPR